MNDCVNLYYLSTLACKISDCLSEDELVILAADLVVLSDMLSNIATRQATCKDKV